MPTNALGQQRADPAHHQAIASRPAIVAAWWRLGKVLPQSESRISPK